MAQIAMKTKTPSRAAQWKAFERSRTPYYRSMERIVRKRFADEMKAVVERAESMIKSTQVMLAVESELDEQGAAWLGTYDRIYTVVGDPFARASYRKLTGKSAGPSDVKQVEEYLWRENVDAYLKRTAPPKIIGIQGTTRAALASTISEGVSEGESINNLVKRIRSSYKQFTPRRARVIARTEVIAASNAGSQAGAIATGLILEKEWMATNDPPRVRDTHADADGQRQAMDAAYSVAGEALGFPGDTSLGASAGNVINCRCTETYVPV